MAQNTRKQTRSLKELREIIATGRKKHATVLEVIYIFMYCLYLYFIIK